MRVTRTSVLLPDYGGLYVGPGERGSAPCVRAGCVCAVRGVHPCTAPWPRPEGCPLVPSSAISSAPGLPTMRGPPERAGGGGAEDRASAPPAVGARRPAVFSRGRSSEADGSAGLSCKSPLLRLLSGSVGAAWSPEAVDGGRRAVLCWAVLGQVLPGCSPSWDRGDGGVRGGGLPPWL